MTPCYACGNEETRVWLAGFEHRYRQDGAERTWPYNLVECRACALGFIDPMPDWNLLQTFYPSDYHCYSRSASFDYSTEHTKYKIARMRYAGVVRNARPMAGLGKRLCAMATEWASGKTISYSLGIPLQLPLDAHIFELGYGTGYWLQIMASLSYQNLYGYDIDANPVDVAKLRALGIHLSTGRFLENDYPQGAFDCIRLEHVFEHLLEPVEVLKKCRAMLKPDGLLVMTFPCKASWSREISSRHWGPLEPPVHLYHHTPASVSLMLESAGLSVLGIKPFSVVEQLAGTINNLITARKMRVPLVGQRLSRALAPAYRFLSAATGRGDFMTVLAKSGTP
jgi:SAM-dependent methyltransferase